MMQINQRIYSETVIPNKGAIPFRSRQIELVERHSILGSQCLHCFRKYQKNSYPG